jgi:hypothetical protein
MQRNTAQFCKTNGPTLHIQLFMNLTPGFGLQVTMVNFINTYIYNLWPWQNKLYHPLSAYSHVMVSKTHKLILLQSRYTLTVQELDTWFGPASYLDSCG